jgi:phasin family protein
MNLRRHTVQQSTPNYFSFVSNLMQQFKLPDFDFPAFLEARRKDFEALTAVNRIAVKGVETVVIKQAEVVRNALEDVQLVMQQLVATGNGGKLASSSEAVQQAVQKTFANVQELADAAQESRSEAFDVLRVRVEQNIEELKSLAGSSK